MKNCPNILFICSDQHGARWTGFDGHQVVKTPSLDRLASEGVAFTRAFSPNPVCVPARAAMMTGMYGSDCQSYCNSTVWDGSHPTWGTLLGREGYSCRATGKFDLDDRREMGFQGKDTKSGHWKKPDIATLFRRPPIGRPGMRHMIDGRSRKERKEVNLVENTLAFLEELKSSDGPWAIYTGFHRPHPSFVGPEEPYNAYLEQDLGVEQLQTEEYEAMPAGYADMLHSNRFAVPIEKARMHRARAAYFAMVTELDEDIGRILEALDASGQADKTLVIYTSDHGESLGCHGSWFKSTFYDESVRVPMIIRGPGVPRGRRVTDPVSLIDLTATVLDYGGARLNGLRGTSLRGLIEGKGTAPPFVFSEYHGQGTHSGIYMIQQGPWKYVEFTYDSDGLLFNLDEDPFERSNRFHDPACQDIRERMGRILRSVADPEDLTERAIKRQKERLRELTEGKDKDAIVAMLESRLGRAQSEALARSLVGID